MFSLQWVEFALRAIVAFVFISFGLEKLGDIPRFTQIIRGYRLLPDAAVPGVARSICVAEIMLGTLLLLGIGVLFVSFGLATLLLVFSGVMLRSLLISKGTMQECGCSGVAGRATSLQSALYRNAGLLAILASIVVVGVHAAHEPSSSLAVAGIAVLAVIVVRAFMLHLALLDRVKRSYRTATSSQKVSASGRFGANQSRRSFIRLAGGIALGAVTAARAGFALPALADHPWCYCDCGDIGDPGPDCQYMIQCEQPGCGTGPVWYVCDYYCCPPSEPSYCDSGAWYEGVGNC